MRTTASGFGTTRSQREIARISDISSLNRRDESTSIDVPSRRTATIWLASYRYAVDATLDVPCVSVIESCDVRNTGAP
jgi:hypothetical protein